MFKPNKIVKCLACIFGIIALSFGISYVVLAWTEPLLPPPECTSGTPGCDEPLNVSGTSQTKKGALVLNEVAGAPNVTTGLIVRGNAVFPEGNVGIGIGTVPTVKLEVAGNVKISGIQEGSGTSPDYKGLYIPNVDMLVGGGTDSTFAFRHLNEAGENNLMIFGNQNIGDAANGPVAMVIDTEYNRVGIGGLGNGTKLGNGKEFLSGELPKAALHIKSDSFILQYPQTPVPASCYYISEYDSTIGMIAWDLNNIYVCVAHNTWKKSALIAL